ncbi:MAG: Ig-like domain-containing protein, partial [bacterium]
TRGAGQITFLFSPQYNTPSDSMNFLPPPGEFVPTDLIRLKLSGLIKDTAGWAIDLNNDKVLDDLDIFKILSAKINRAPFFVQSTVPENMNIAPPDSRIIINFASAMDTASIDANSISVSSVITGSTLFVQDFDVNGNVLTLTMEEAFFTGDTITVRLDAKLRNVFGNYLDGNNDGISALRVNLQDTTDNFTLIFIIEAAEFYIFPNPYKPAKDPRHAALGGITLKNVSSLTGISKYCVIRIFNVAGNLIFESENIAAHPIWTWHAVNQGGRPVRSGLYLYTINGERDKVLLKGKMVVVR